ncbi:P-loop containing nucleoside triphosphate hydrolase protein [Elsinoe ampelina]|uniref:P-loop containing nucleoside triphosphate hydrolase protein n=1 Tax=Elsinoe ampelina TaxID=302913 RepID=A0A6A6GPX6_9PEZI|nr:P-loop containing nucleoside triphosphate hydrolase protein [Elsinoe ampelina]
MGSALSREPLWAHLRVNTPHRTLILLGMNATGKSSILQHLAKDSSSDVKYQTSTSDFCSEWLDLPNTSIKILNCGSIHPGFKEQVQDYVRRHADGVILSLDAIASDDDWNDSMYILRHYILDVKETKDCPLLVLINRCDEERARSLTSIEQKVEPLLAERKGSTDRHCIKAINAKTGAGLDTSLDWLSQKLNS